MHYRDGSPAKVGDLAQTADEAQTLKVLGRVVKIIPEADKGNALIVPLARDHGDGVWMPNPPQSYPDAATLSEMLPLAPITRNEAKPARVGAGA